MTEEEIKKIQKRVKCMVTRLKNKGYIVDEDDISAITLILLECNNNGIYGNGVTTRVRNYFNNKNNISSNEILMDDENIHNLKINNEFEKEIKDLNLKLFDELLDTLFKYNYLTERELFCLKKYYYDNMILDEVGDLIGVTRERIRQILAKALRKIRRYISTHNLFDMFTFIEENPLI